MKIALYHNLPSGGARRAMVEMVKGLVARGHLVDEFCLQTADLSFQPLNGIVGRTHVSAFQPLGIATKRVPLLTPYITAIRLARDLQSSLKVSRQIAQLIDYGAYDVVFTHDCQLVFVPDILQFLQLPTVHYCHSAGGIAFRSLAADRLGGDTEFLLKQLYYAPARQFYPWLRFRRTRRNLRSAQRVLTNSAFTATELQQSFGVQSQVCYLGVDVSQFRPLDLPRGPFVLSVGAVHYHKGFRFLIEALAKLPQSLRPPLVIAANSIEPEELQILYRLAASLHVELSVQSTLNDRELIDLYNRAMAFVYSPICEPWGLAVVEAMACGTVVVAVGEGGVSESVVDSETGFLTTRHVDKFAAALRRVLLDPTLARHLGVAGVARARTHFTWSQSVDRLEMHLNSARSVRSH